MAGAIDTGLLGGVLLISAGSVGNALVYSSTAPAGTLLYFDLRARATAPTVTAAPTTGLGVSERPFTA